MLIINVTSAITDTSGDRNKKGAVINGFLSRERITAGPGFNRWLIPPAALMVHLSIGEIYAFSVFKNPLVERFGVGLTPIAIIFSISIVMLGLSAAVFGTWVERAGPRAAMFTAALCWSGGFAIGALGVATSQLWLVYLGYGFVGGIGLGIGYISPVSTLIKWFPDRPGLATGLAIMGFGGGALIASPLSSTLLETYASNPVNAIVPSFLTLGAAYEERPRLSGGAYQPILRRVDEFLDEPMSKALKERERRSRRILKLDDAVTAAVEKLKAKGLTSPYLKPFVVARVNYTRFSKATSFDFDEAPRLWIGLTCDVMWQSWWMRYGGRAVVDVLVDLAGHDRGRFAFATFHQAIHAGHHVSAQRLGRLMAALAVRLKQRADVAEVADLGAGRFGGRCIFGASRSTQRKRDGRKRKDRKRKRSEHARHPGDRVEGWLV